MEKALPPAAPKYAGTISGRNVSIHPSLFIRMQVGQLINVITDFLHRIYDLLHLSLAVGSGQPGLHPVEFPIGYLLTDRQRS